MHPSLPIHTTWISLPLGGGALVAATATGICALTLGDNPAALRDDLRRRFPIATLQAADTGLHNRAARFLDAFANRDADALAGLPLDLDGTPFQQRVWAALRQIPFGATTTYTALAAAIGCPSSVRAVANACGANPVAILVPCHRVVRSDGALSGYRWGVERKAALLRHESDSLSSSLLAA
jgi:AraC family transcriptional regulator of adaptative response/methylated-DNA-[protein]-cysteine methyltransferase